MISISINTNSKANIQKWLDEMLERNRTGAIRPGDVRDNRPLPAETLEKMRELGTRMVNEGLWRGDISEELLKLDPDRQLDDLYL